MFANVGMAEVLVIVIVGLVVLGPERLPEAARWLASTIRQVKEFAGKAQQQLKDDFGTDLEEFREPLQQINQLRGVSPRALVTKHLLDGDDSLFTNPFDAAAPAGRADSAAPPSRPQTSSGGATATPSTPAPGPGSPTDPPPATGPTVWDVDAT